MNRSIPPCTVLNARVVSDTAKIDKYKTVEYSDDTNLIRNGANIISIISAHTAVCESAVI